MRQLKKPRVAIIKENEVINGSYVHGVVGVAFLISLPIVVSYVLCSWRSWSRICYLVPCFAVVSHEPNVNSQAAGETSLLRGFPASVSVPLDSMVRLDDDFELTMFA